MHCLVPERKLQSALLCIVNSDKMAERVKWLDPDELCDYLVEKGFPGEDVVALESKCAC